MDIEQILADHAKWLLGGHGGIRADFFGENLSGVDFSKVSFFTRNLSDAILLGAYWDDGLEGCYINRWTIFTNRSH